MVLFFLGTLTEVLVKQILEPRRHVCRAMPQDGDAGILGLQRHILALLERVWEGIWEGFERMLFDEEVKAYSFVEGIPTVGAGMVRIPLASICLHKN